jgi:hypothetical protein
MTTRAYRLTVVGCALAWLLLGMHLPTSHELMDHGRVPPPPVLAMSMVLAAIGTTTLWILLRVPFARR